MRNQDTVPRALTLAANAHEGQLYGDKNYIYHLFCVVEVLRRYEIDTEVMVAAAWLHDSVEDTEVTTEQIRAGFGDDIAELVFAVTSEEGKSRRERNARTYPKISVVPGATALKLADRIANVESCWAERDSRLFMYQREYKGFRKALRSQEADVPDFKGEASWVVRLMWDHLDKLLGWRDPA